MVNSDGTTYSYQWCQMLNEDDKNILTFYMTWAILYQYMYMASIWFFWQPFNLKGSSKWMSTFVIVTSLWNTIETYFLFTIMPYLNILQVLFECWMEQPIVKKENSVSPIMKLIQPYITVNLHKRHYK